VQDLLPGQAVGLVAEDAGHPSPGLGQLRRQVGGEEGADRVAKDQVLGRKFKLHPHHLAGAGAPLSPAGKLAKGAAGASYRN
jgi:hypothetical protein